MTGAATVRKCRTVAKTVPLRRYYQMGCLPVRTPVEFGPLAIGVPRDSLSMICMCLFFAFSGAKDASMGFRTFVPSNAPQSGNFGRSRRCHRIDRCRAHARGILRVGSPSPKISPEISPPCTFKKPSNFKDLRKISPISPISPGCLGYWGMRLHTHAVKTPSCAPGRSPAKSTKYPRNPQNIHEPQTAQTRANARFPENIHEIHNIHGIPWMRVSCARRMGLSPRAGLHGSRKTHAVRRGRFC